jgi:phosphoglycolate phosphatase-like HAD superfamily hydrolase
MMTSGRGSILALPFYSRAVFALRLSFYNQSSAQSSHFRLGKCPCTFRFQAGLRVAQERFVEEFCAALDFQITYSEFCDLWSCIFLPGTLIPDSLLETLSARYPLVLLSNTNPIHFGMVKANYPILRHFHHYVLSHEVGAAKPSPEIYQQAIRRAGCTAQECFFTDDIPLYVEAAQALGIDAVRFQSAEQIEQELRARGVLWGR